MKLKILPKFAPFIDRKPDKIKFQKTLKFESNCSFITLFFAKI